MKQKCMILQKSVIAFRGVLLYDICMKRNADSPINRRCISPLSARLPMQAGDFLHTKKQHLHAVLPVVHIEKNDQVVASFGSFIANASASDTVHAEPFAS